MRLLVLVLALLLVAPAAARAQKIPEPEVARVGSFVVHSEVDLSGERAAAIASRVRAAWEFAVAEHAWTGADALLAREVHVRVLSDEKMKELSPKAKGIAHGPDTFVITARFLEEERSERTLAHELTHLQDRRHLVAKGSKLPHWLKEGRAVATGRDYEAKLGVRDRRYDDSIARVASSLTVAEAKKILEDDAYIAEKKMPSIFRMEATGFYFLEFVRAHGQLDRFEPRLAKVVARVGQGATLEAAFEAELGRGLGALRADFYEHLEKTAGRERLRGTALER